jgi:hypothetical protein
MTDLLPVISLLVVYDPQFIFPTLIADLHILYAKHLVISRTLWIPKKPYPA